MRGATLLLLLAAGPDAEQAWLTSRFPEVADYTPARAQDRALADLLAWATPKGTAYDRRCRPVRLERRGAALYGLVNVQTQRDGDTRTVRADELLLDRALTLTCGFTTTSRRDAKGRWAEVSSTAMGCADQVALGLGRVTSDAVWYDAAEVRLSIGCVEVARTCDGPCRRCGRYGVITAGGGPGFGVATHVQVRTSTAACPAACPPDPAPPDVDRANRQLADQRYFIDGDPHPILFRTRAACRAYRARHPIGEDDLDPW